MRIDHRLPQEKQHEGNSQQRQLENLSRMGQIRKNISLGERSMHFGANHCWAGHFLQQKPPITTKWIFQKMPR